jgi:hypothetical protein
VRGIKLLKQTKVFNYFKPLLSREDLCRLILVSIDYNTTYSRMLLKNILLVPSPVMRYLATRHLQLLYRAGVNNFASWGVEFALQQIEDKERKVRQASFNLLFEISSNKECLSHLIGSQRGSYFLSTDEFKEAKHIIYRFLSLPEGFFFYFIFISFIFNFFLFFEFYFYVFCLIFNFIFIFVYFYLILYLFLFTFI